MPLLSLAEKALLSILRRSGYQVASHLPDEWLLWLRRRSVLRDLLKRLSINCVFDVGANQGQFGTMLRQMRFTGRIFSFEPVRANVAHLQEVAAAAEPWTVFPYALGEKDGYLPINVTERTLFSSFLTPAQESQARFPGNRAARTEDVEVRCLDRVFDECLHGISSPRVYLKLDTQGFDIEVAKGAESVLGRVLALQTEISFHPIYDSMPNFTTSISVFQAHGFEVVDFVPVTRQADQMRVIEMDCVMVRKLDPGHVCGAP